MSYSVTSTIKKFTIAPMLDGLTEYTEQISQMQTIIQNTMQHYDASNVVDQLGDVTSALDDLNEYADLTIYKFSDMTNAVQGFATAGLNVNDATAMTKGLASLTAYAGKGAQTYASVAYMFNQAIQAGKMQGYQWRSISMSQVGGLNAQRLFVETAEALGVDHPEIETFESLYEDDGITLKAEVDEESFKESLADDWLTTPVMVNAMKVLAGAYNVVDAAGNLNEEATKEVLAAEGYSETVQQMAIDAFKKASEVRSFAQATDAIFESIGTGWAQVFRVIFGDSEQATSLWTNWMNTVTKSIGGAMDSVKKSFEDAFGIYDDNGELIGTTGPEKIEELLTNVWKIIANIGKSLKSVFSALTGGKSIGDIFKNLVDGAISLSNVILGIEKPATILQTIFYAIGKTVSYLSSVVNKLFGIIKKLWDYLLPIRERISNVILSIGPTIKKVIDSVVGWIDSLATKFSESGFVDTLSQFWDTIADGFNGMTEGGIGGLISSILDGITGLFSGVDVDGIFGVVSDLINGLINVFKGAGDSFSAWDFVSLATKVWLVLTALKPIFKKIAKIGESFNSVTASFTKIIGTVLAIMIAVQILDKVKFDSMLDLVKKAIMLRIVLSQVGKALENLVGNAKTVALLAAIAIILAGFLAAVSAILYFSKKYGVDGDEIANAFSDVVKMLSVLGVIVGLMAVIFVAMAIKAKHAAAAANKSGDSMTTLVNAIKKGKFTANLNISFGDEFVRRIAAMTAMITAVGVSIKMILDALEPFSHMNNGRWWAAISAFVVIMIGITASIAVMLWAVKKFSVQTSVVEAVLKKNDSLKGKKSNGASSSGLWALAAIITAIGVAVGGIASAIAQLSKYDFGDSIGPILTVAGIFVGLAVAVRLISKQAKKLTLKDAASLFVIANIASTISTSVAMIAGVIALLSWLESKGVIREGTKALNYVASIFLLVAGFTLLLTAIAKNAKFDIKSLALTGVMLVALEELKSILVVTALLTMLDTGKLWDATNAVLIITAAMTLFVATISLLTIAMSKAQSPIKAATSMLVISGVVMVFVGAIAVLVAAVESLAKIGWSAFVDGAKKLSFIVGGIVVLVGVLVTCLILIAKIEGLAMNLIKVSSSIGIVVLAVAAFAAGLYLLSKLDTKAMWVGYARLSAIVGIVLAMIALIRVIGMIPNDTGTAITNLATIAIVVGSLFALGLMVVEIGSAPGENVANGIAAITQLSALVLGIVAILRKISNIDVGGGTAKTMLSFASVIGAMALLTGAVYFLTDCRLGDLEKGVLVVLEIGAVLVGMYAIIRLVSKIGDGGTGTAKTLAAFSAIAGMIAALSLVVVYLGKQSLSDLEKGVLVILEIGAIISGIYLLTAIISKIGANSSSKGLAPLITIIAGLVIIATQIERIAALEDVKSSVSTLMMVAGVLAVLMLVVGMMGYAIENTGAGKMLAATAVLIVVALGIALIVQAISAIPAGTDLLKMAGLLTAISGLLVGIVVVVALMSQLIKDPFTIAGLALLIALILAVGASVYMMTTGLSRLSDSLTDMTVSFKAVSTGIINMLSVISQFRTIMASFGSINTGPFESTIEKLASILEKHMSTFEKFRDIINGISFPDGLQNLVVVSGNASVVSSGKTDIVGDDTIELETKGDIETPKTDKIESTGDVNAGTISKVETEGPANVTQPSQSVDVGTQIGNGIGITVKHIVESVGNLVASGVPKLIQNVVKLFAGEDIEYGSVSGGSADYSGLTGTLNDMDSATFFETLSGTLQSTLGGQLDKIVNSTGDSVGSTSTFAGDLDALGFLWTDSAKSKTADVLDEVYADAVSGSYRDDNERISESAIANAIREGLTGARIEFDEDVVDDLGSLVLTKFTDGVAYGAGVN